MKNIIKSVVITILSISTLISCSYIDQNQAADVEKLLKEKYNQDFVVTDIGGRYGTAENDTVTTYVHPDGKENLVFKAVMNNDGSFNSDAYIPRLIGDQLNKILKQELEKAGIESETFTFVMNADKIVHLKRTQTLRWRNTYRNISLAIFLHI